MCRSATRPLTTAPLQTAFVKTSDIDKNPIMALIDASSVVSVNMNHFTAPVSQRHTDEWNVDIPKSMAIFVVDLED